jgi:hypothetical protein
MVSHGNAFPEALNAMAISGNFLVDILPSF